MQVRAAAVRAVGGWLGNAQVLDMLSESPRLSEQAAAWTEAIGNALLDPAHLVCSCAFSAVRFVQPFVVTEQGHRSRTYFYPESFLGKGSSIKPCIFAL